MAGPTTHPDGMAGPTTRPDGMVATTTSLAGPHAPVHRRSHPRSFGKRPLAVVLVVQAGEPAGQAVLRGLEAGVEIDKIAHPLGQPGDGQLLLAPPVRQLLDAAVGVVHAPCLIRSVPYPVAA